MKLNPFQRQTSSANQDSSDLVNYDESVLQQGQILDEDRHLDLDRYYGVWCGLAGSGPY